MRVAPHLNDSRRWFLTSALCLLVLTGGAARAASPAEGDARLLRMPDLHGERLVFVHGGDLWTAPVEGGSARRLTSHPGLELFPKYSPDGRWIAFSAEYGGNRQVFVIPSEGGEPKQLTWYNDVGPMPPRGGWDYWTLGWTPDSSRVLFRGNRLPWSERMGRYYTVPVAGGLETPLAVPEGGSAALSPDGKRLAYTPIDREFRTWKRYRGGRNQDLWIFDLTNNSAEPIVESPAVDNQPVWIGDTIYFTSDRDEHRKLNIWAWDLAQKSLRQITRHDEYDVLWPGGDASRLVYENGGFIYVLDPARPEPRRVPIRIEGDAPHALPRLARVRDRIQAADLSPSGARALFTARGEVFTLPAKDGEARLLTRTPEARERDAAWSPDGRTVAYLSDRSGEYEIYLRAADGGGEERRLTTGGETWMFAPVWSPDSRMLAWGDKRQRLRAVDVESGRITDIDTSPHSDITTSTWSPDSRSLIYVKQSASQFRALWLWSRDTGRATALTGELTDNFGPVFDRGGKYLYFLSNRDFNLTFSDWEFNYLYTGPTRIYVAALSAATPLPLAPKSDEEKPTAESKAEGAAGDAGKDTGKKGSDKEADKDADRDAGKSTNGDQVPAVRIDVEGFENRVTALPPRAGNYAALTGLTDGVMYLTGTDDLTLKSFSIADEKEETVLEAINDYTVSADGRKVLYRKATDWGIVDAKPGQKNSEGRLKLDLLVARVEPRVEWRQMYTDAWRILRDWFYDPGLHGLDWQEMHDRYAALLPWVTHRADLDVLLGELGGELNAGHVYVGAGDMPRLERVDNGLLGVELEADASGRYRIAKIYRGENWHPDFRSPLTEPGVTAAAGEFLIAVDGVPVTTRDNPYRFLEGKAGRVVTLRLNARPEEDGGHDEKVRPVAKETDLRYLDWVLDRRRRVEEASGGRIGYIHLPNTANEGNRELFKYFYPQSGKDALIVDARYNGGGFIPDRMIELLDRPELSWWARRGVTPTATPGFAHQGPKVCLINGYSSSGGDAFPWYFRKRALGPLIGTRTWGGLIGISGNPGLVDGGSVTPPTFRFFDRDGWQVEGIGVAPDIEVVDRPDRVARGEDPSLEKAIEMLMAELAKKPPVPVRQPRPWVDRP